MTDLPELLGNLSVANLNPLRYRGYYCDSETGFYYLQSRYYDPIVRRFLNADSFASTGQGILGYNMFAYCNNNPVISTDSTGHSCVALDPVLGGGGGKKEPEVKVPTCTNSSGTTHGGNSGSSGASHPNDATICYMFGVDSVEQVPGYEPGCMFFAENTYAVSVSKVVSIVHGKTVIMDRDKYCIYVFAGVSPGISYRGCPGDATITQGVVYGVSTPSDYSGIFVGATDNMVAMGAGGAIAPNGVSARVLTLQGYLGPSIGASVTYYAGSSEWIYGVAPVCQTDRRYYNPYIHNNNHAGAAPAQIGMKTEAAKFPVFLYNVFERGTLQSTVGGVARNSPVAKAV